MTYIGSIPTGSNAKTIVNYIKEIVDAGGYDDSTLKANIAKNTAAIATLNGTGDGSVKKAVSDAVASIVNGAPEAYDTLKEISDWISSHASDAAGMNSQIKTNKEDVAKLKTLIGTLGNLFTKNANPKIGDIVIFYRSGEFKHTGIVTKVQGDKFWTIEGNTSGASGIVANGGGVCEKSYYNSQLPGTKFCTPDYSLVTSILSGISGVTTSVITPTNTKNYLQYGDTGSEVKTLQTKLNKVGYKLAVDGSYGDATKAAVKSFQTKYKLEVDGIAGKNTIAKLDAVIAVQNKNTSTANKTPSKTPKFVGKVTADSLNVRTGAGTKNAQLKSYPTLKKNNLVDVCDTVKTKDNSEWYYIRIAGKYYGYAAKKYIAKQ